MSTSFRVRSDWTSRALPALFLMLVLCFALTGCPQLPLPPQTSLLEVTVLLNEGESLEGTEVLLPGTAYRGYTDQNGHVVFDRLPPRSYEVLVKRDGYQLYREPRLELLPGDHLDLGLIQLVPEIVSGTITGVVHTGERPEPNVLVQVAEGPESATTDESGQFRLEDLALQAHTLIFTAPGVAAPKVLAVTVTEDNPFTTVRLNLAAEDRDAVTSPGCLIGSLRTPDPAALVDLVVSFPTLQLQTQVDSTGNFAFPQIPSGSHPLFIHGPYAIDQVLPAVVILPGSTECTQLDLSLETPNTVRTAAGPSGSYLPVSDGASNVSPDAPGIVAGSVFFSDRTEHAGITVRLVQPAAEVESSADGSFILPEVPPGVVTIRAEAEGYEAAELDGLEVLPGRLTRAPRLVLEPLGGPPPPLPFSSVQGTILLGGEQTHLGSLVSLEGTSIAASTGRDGAFVLDPVPPGEYMLLISHSGFEPQAQAVSVPPDSDVIFPPVTLEAEKVFMSVVETSPGDGTRDVPITDRVVCTLRFNERLQPRGLENHISVSPSVAKDIGWNGIDLVTLELPRQANPGVAFDTRYTITVGTGLTSAAGHSLAEPFDFSFRTGGPMVLGTIPEGDARSVVMTINQPILIDFNEPVDLEDLRDKLRFTPDSGEIPVLIPQRMPFGQRIQVQMQLEESRRYRLTIPSTVRTRSGERYDNTPFNVSFRTGSFDELPDRTDEYLREIDDFLPR